MTTASAYTTPDARFAVSGLGFTYTLWDNAGGKFMTPLCTYRKLDTAYAVAEFMNKHTRTGLLALPAPFTPVPTDTGLDHGPHNYVISASDYRVFTTTPTLRDAQKWILAQAEEAVRESMERGSYTRVTGNYVVDMATRNATTWRHPFWNYDRGEAPIVDNDVARVIRQLASDGNPPAYQILAKWRVYISPDAIGNVILPEYETGQLSYHPRTRVYDANQGHREQKGRVSGKPVRILKTLYPDVTGTDAEWEVVNTKLGAMMANGGTFAVVTGDDLLDAYCEDNYSPSVTWHSCMKYAHCRDYLALYAQNPEQVSLLILRDDDGLTMARSLIWQTADGVYQDRIYASNDRETERMRTYARTTLGVVGNYRGTVHLSTYENLREFPYMDTFTYYEPSTGTLSDYDGYFDGEYYELCSTSGGYETKGVSRTYSVTIERTVTQYATITIEAADYDDAMMQARDEIRWVDDDDVEIYDTTNSSWYAQDAEVID